MAFLINILNVSARPHHAGRIMAVDEPEGMSEFMDYLLAEPLLKNGIICLYPIPFVAETVDGSNPGTTVQESLPEYIGQNGNKKVYIK